MTSDAHRLSSRLARWNALSFGLVFGLVSASALFVATWVLVLATPDHPGPHLGLLAQYLPGYSVTKGGAFVGFAWVAALGALFATPAAWIYYLGVLRKIERAGAPGEVPPLDVAEAPIHVRTFSLAVGLFCGLLAFLATFLLVVKHEPGTPLGPTLGILGRYLPGYEVSIGGSLVGFAYALAGGAVTSALVACVYNGVRRRLPPVRRARDADGGKAR